MSDINLENIFKNYPIEEKEVAEVLGVSIGSVYNWRSGQRNIDPARLKLLNQYIRERYESNNTTETNNGSIRDTITNEFLFDWGGFQVVQDLTQVELAELLGVTQAYVSQMKKDFHSNRPVSQTIAKKLQELYSESELRPHLHQRKIKKSPKGGSSEEEKLRMKLEHLEKEIRMQEEIIKLLKENNHLLQQKNRFSFKTKFENG